MSSVLIRAHHNHPPRTAPNAWHSRRAPANEAFAASAAIGMVWRPGRARRRSRVQQAPARLFGLGADLARPAEQGPIFFADRPFVCVSR